GGLLMVAGIAPDTAMRITGLVCFLLSAIALFVLARRVLSKPGAIAALAAYTFNAHALLYGRASLIEYLATGASVAMVIFALRFMDGRGSANWGLAAAFGVIAVLVKITTGGFYLVPILLWRGMDRRFGFQRPSIWVLAAGVTVVALGWSSYAQGVRAEQPAAAFLALQNQLGWFFGTLGEHFDMDRWRYILVAILSLTGSGVIGWAPLAVSQSRAHAQRPFLLSLLIVTVTVPLLLFNLYSVHDYYWIAVAPGIAIAVGLGVEWILERGRTRRARRIGVALAGAWLATLVGLAGTWTIIYGEPVEQPRAFHIAEFIRDHSAEDDWVVVNGLDWNTTFLYYARRMGLAVPEPNAALQDASRIDFASIFSDPIYGPFITCDIEGSCAVTERP
ncbi:MAG: glycosyltransferase family 39 protein, partial [Chloroflexota bacterium]